MAYDFSEVDLKELSELLHSVQNIRFGIGVHSAGLHQDSLGEREKIAQVILEDGIKLRHGYHSILGNVQSLGRNFDISSSGILRFLLDDIEVTEHTAIDKEEMGQRIMIGIQEPINHKVQVQQEQNRQQIKREQELYDR